MTSKLLPVPLGDFAPQGSTVRWWHQYAFRRGLDNVMYGAGLLLAIAGAWLGLTRSPVAVSVDRAGYHVGGAVMTTVAPGVFAGDAAVVIHRDGDVVRAGASGKYGADALQGVCIMVVGSGREECIFVVGHESITADDRLRGGAWHRRYMDGVTVEIRVPNPGNPTPVPLPVGRG